MGSSARKRANKRADFVKPKLRVGKARPKAANFTDTSFASRSISIPTQSLRQDAPSSSAQISTHISHLSSHNSAQRSDHLKALTTHLSSSPSTLPLSSTTLISTLNPLFLDPDSRVRSQVLKIYALLPASDITSSIERILPHVRAGMAHLSTDIRVSNLDMLAWLLNNAFIGPELVSCAGGWVKTLKIFVTILGWTVVPSGKGDQEEGEKRGGWTDRSSGIKGGGGNRGPIDAKILTVLAAFLRCGLLPPIKPQSKGEVEEGEWPFPLRNTRAHMISTVPNPFAHLNLFGEPRDEEGEMYVDETDRRRVFRKLGYEDAIRQGVEGMRKDGGETGRAAGIVAKVLKEIAGYDEI